MNYTYTLMNGYLAYLVLAKVLTPVIGRTDRFFRENMRTYQITKKIEKPAIKIDIVFGIYPDSIPKLYYNQYSNITDSYNINNYERYLYQIESIERARLIWETFVNTYKFKSF